MGVAERRERERQGRVDLILKAARHLFATRGFENVSMAEISKEAELAKGTIYIYFQSKQELYYALLEPLLVRHQRELKALVSSGDEPAEVTFKKLCDYLFNLYSSQPDAYRIVARYDAKEFKKLLSPDKFDRLRELMRSNVTNFQTVIDRGVEQGVFQTENTRVAAVIFWNLFYSILIYQENRLEIGGNDYRKSTLDAGLGIFLDGIRRR